MVISRTSTVESIRKAVSPLSGAAIAGPDASISAAPAAEMARALGASSPGKNVPVSVLHAVARGCEVLSPLLRRRAPLTRAQVKRLAAHNVYESRRMREIIEVSRCVSLSDGMARAVSSEKAVPVRQRRRE